MPEDCKLKRTIGSVQEIPAIVEEAKGLVGRCDCKVVTLIFKPKDNFTTITVACLRGRRKAGA